MQSGESMQQMDLLPSLGEVWTRAEMDGRPMWAQVPGSVWTMPEAMGGHRVNATAASLKCVRQSVGRGMLLALYSDIRAVLELIKEHKAAAAKRR